MNLSKKRYKIKIATKVMFLSGIVLEVVAMLALVVEVTTSTTRHVGIAELFAVLVIWIAVATFCLWFLSKYRNAPMYHLLMAIPIGISLALWLFFFLTDLQLLQKTIEEAKRYSTIFNEDVSIWRWILYFVMEYGPTVIMLIALLFAGYSCLKKKKTKVASILLLVAATVQLMVAIQTLSYRLPTYLHEFGFDMALYTASSSLASNIVLFGIAVLLIPKFVDNLSSSDFQ